MTILPRFYVYVLVRPNGKPFYVGKGTKGRIFEHDTEARSGHKCYKCNVIRKIWKNGDQFQRYTIFTTDDEQEALDYEKETIALYGRKNLCNLTDGGEGASNPSAQTLAKRRASVLKTNATPETKAKRSAASKKVVRTPEWRARQSAALKGRTISPEAREKIRQTLTGRKQSPEAIEKKRQSQIGGKMPASFSAKLSARMKGLAKTDEQRQKISQTLKEKGPWRGKNHTPESIQKMREAQSNADWKGKAYECHSPDGTVHTIRNLVRFCSEHILDYRGVQRAIYTNKAYKGWRFTRLT